MTVTKRGIQYVMETLYIQKLPCFALILFSLHKMIYIIIYIHDKYYIYIIIYNMQYVVCVCMCVCMYGLYFYHQHKLGSPGNRKLHLRNCLYQMSVGNLIDWLVDWLMMIDVRGPSPLWAAQSLGRLAWAVLENRQ